MRLRYTILPLAAALALLSLASARPSKREEDFSHYLSNDTLIGKTVPCTDAEKECLRYNKLLYKKNGRCYPMGNGPKGCRFFVDRREFEYGEGHLRGICLPKEQCPKAEVGSFLMAYDAQCLPFHVVIGICNRQHDLEYASHFFGGTECVKLEYESPKNEYIAQPEESGKCVFPNLRNDFTSIQTMEKKRYGFNCDAEFSECFAKGLVWYEAARSCFPLFQQGPCQEGHHLVLKHVEKKKTVASKCAPTNPCKSNQRLMAFDGNCHETALIRLVLCPTGVLLSNAFGQLSCTGVKDMYKHVIQLESAREGSCEIEQRVSHSLVGSGVKVIPDCSLTEEGSCSRAVNELLRSVPLSRHHNEVGKPFF